MKIKQSVINTFNRVGIDHEALLKEEGKVHIENRFGGGSCETSPFIAYLIGWVYSTSNDYEFGLRDVRLDDFDRVRYFVLEKDSNAYMTCLD